MNDAGTGPIELATHATALAEAIRTGRAVPAGRLFGLPELPGDDYWLDMAGATASTGIPPKTITGWLAGWLAAARSATPSRLRNDFSTGCTGPRRRSHRGVPENKPQPGSAQRPDHTGHRLRRRSSWTANCAGRELCP